MNVYVYETSTSGTSEKIIAAKQTSNFQPFQQITPTDSLLNPTFQIITTSATSGTIQGTLNGTDFSDLIDFSSTTTDNQTVVYDGILTDFRIVTKSIIGTLKIIVGI